jgi:hypothetical protein
MNETITVSVERDWQGERLSASVRMARYMFDGYWIKGDALLAMVQECQHKIDERINRMKTPTKLP